MTTDPLTACALCPRLCRADRAAGKTGFCGAGLIPRVFRYGPHFGEEPPISGSRGSGTVFFSHCTLACIYCQNHPWSQKGQGEDIGIEGLTTVFQKLYNQGCHNWNLVSPTPWLPQIKKAAEPLFRTGVSLPFVYNVSGFEHEQALEAYAELADIALIDLRYARPETALAGSGRADYVEAARRAIRWLWNRRGALECDDEGIARSGVICRLLALPGREEEVIASLRWLKKEVGTEIAVSVMAQYKPVYRALETPGWDCAIDPDAYARVVDAVESLGFENGWVQACDDTVGDTMLGQDMAAGEGTVG